MVDSIWTTGDKVAQVGGNATAHLSDRARAAVAVRPGVRLDGEVLDGLGGVDLDEVGEDHVEGVHCGWFGWV